MVGGSGDQVESGGVAQLDELIVELLVEFAMDGSSLPPTAAMALNAVGSSFMSLFSGCQ